MEEQDVEASAPAHTSVSLTDLVRHDPPEEDAADPAEAGHDGAECADEQESTTREQDDPSEIQEAPAGDSPGSPQAEALPAGKPFRTVIRLATLDERNCPGPRQRARAFEISPKHVGLKTRNMVHISRRVAVVIDRIDDRPTVVFGRVVRCSYAGGGEYTTMVRFEEIPEWQDVQDWAGGSR
ncbi:MAG: hypothetical protein D8M59_10245 [Planctomycetes bacterium]|nr:hypothetical protein [Planctomycetota bacterium]